jgi:hypothetical protein
MAEMVCGRNVSKAGKPRCLWRVSSFCFLQDTRRGILVELRLPLYCITYISISFGLACVLNQSLCVLISCEQITCVMSLGNVYIKCTINISCRPFSKYRSFPKYNFYYLIISYIELQSNVMYVHLFVLTF